MKINYLKGRYHLEGILDKPSQPQKGGISGYWHFLGCFLEKMHYAIRFTDETGKKFFFNRVSAIKYINRHQGKLPLTAQAVEIQRALQKIGTPSKHVNPEFNPAPQSKIAGQVPINHLKTNGSGTLPIQPLSVNTAKPETIVPQEKAGEISLEKLEEPQETKVPFSQNEVDTNAIKWYLKWCQEASIEDLTKNFNDFIKDSSKKVLADAFKVICDRADVTSFAVLNMMKTLEESSWTRFTDLVVPHLKPDQWKKLALCWVQPTVEPHFKKMIATIPNPTFLYAFFPAARSSAACLDLFELWKSKSNLFEEALNNYYQSPHYKEHGGIFWRYLNDQKEIKEEFINLLAEKATDEQLIDLSLSKEFDSEYLKERLKKISMESLLSISFNAYRGALPQSLKVILQAQSLILPLLRLQEIDLNHLDIEQRSALYYVSNDKFRRQGIFNSCRESSEKMEQFLEKIASSLNPAMLPNILDSLAHDGMTSNERLFLYTHLNPDCRKAFFSSQSQKILTLDLMVSLIKNHHYALAAEMLQEFEEKRLIELANFCFASLSAEDYLGMFAQVPNDAFIRLVEKIFTTIDHMKNLLPKSSYTSLTPFVIANHIPKEKLSEWLEIPALKTSVFGLQIAFAMAETEEQIVKILNIIEEKKDQILIPLSHIIGFIGKHNNNLMFILKILQKKSFHCEYLKHLLILIYINETKDEAPEMVGQFDEFLLTMDNDVLIKLLGYSKTGEKTLKTLVSKLNKVHLTILLKSIKNKPIYNSMDQWAPQDFAKFMSCFYEKNYAFKFFSKEFSEERYSLFQACMYDNNNDLQTFVEDARPPVSAMKELLKRANPQQKDVLRNYIAKRAESSQEFQNLKNEIDILPN